jgi:hypothetical protein
MELIQESYIQGDFDECLALTLDHFSGIKNHFDKGTRMVGSYPTTKLVHKCERMASCRCVGLIKYLISVKHQMGGESMADDVRVVLTSSIFEPELRVPYPAFVCWAKFLIYIQKLDEAEQLIKAYISSSTHL